MQSRHWAMVGASGVFILGALVYPLRAYMGGLDGVVFGSFSAFAHALFFALAWAYPFHSKRSLFIGAAVIGVIVTGFELLQIPEYWQSLQGRLPDVVLNYAKAGVFDPLDIAAGLLGISVAVAGGYFLTIRKD